MRAVILAAGRGSRLKPHTDDVPKGLLPLGDTTPVHRTVGILHQLGVSDVSMVVGYLKHAFFEAFPNGVRFYVNDDYDATDQAASLWEARAEFEEDVLVVTGDLFCPESVYVEMLRYPAPISIAVDRRGRAFDNTIEKVLFEGNGIARIGKLNVSDAEANAEFMGMTLFRRHISGDTLRRLQTVVERDRRSAIVHVHQDFIDAGHPLGYVECGDDWCEIDDIESLEKARRMLGAGTAA